jgi:hypothetical protein
MKYTGKKNIKFFVIILFYSVFSCSKKDLNYINYYQKVNEIDSIYRFNNQPQIAVEEYKKLFEVYEPRNQEKIREYETYIVLADKYNIDFGGKTSLKKLIYLTAPYSVFGSGKEYYPLYKKYGIDSIEVKNEINKWKNSLNQTLLDSLSIAMIRDQKNRSNRDSLIIADSKNAVLLKQIFEKNGYPSIYKVGFKGKNNTNINIPTIFLHMAESKDYENLKNKLYQFIKSGECPPNVYSTMVDRHKALFNKRILYGDYGIIENIDSASLAKNRKALGLPSLQHYRKISRDKHAFKNLVEEL